MFTDRNKFFVYIQMANAEFTFSCDIDALVICAHWQPRFVSFVETSIY